MPGGLRRYRCDAVRSRVGPLTGFRKTQEAVTRTGDRLFLPSALAYLISTFVAGAAISALALAVLAWKAPAGANGG